jgi:hypothetical protein
MPGEQERVYVVQMLMRHSVTVAASSDIEAEIEAFKKLSPDERTRIERWRVCDATSKPLVERDPNRTSIHGSWDTPDLAWLKGNLDG